MKTLTTPVQTQIASRQSQFAELYDFYLPSPITTPWGTISILRLTNLPGGTSFFTPTLSPEPSGTQGAAAAYKFWNLKRQTVKATDQHSNDKVVIAASNVTADWATMLDALDWEAVPVVIRKISPAITSPTANDCAILFIGNVDTAKITLEQLQFTCSNDFGTFSAAAPRENMHEICRFQYGDDLCTQIGLSAANYKTKTCAAGSTKSTILSAGLTEDTGSDSTYGTDLVAALPNASITASSFQGAVSAAVTFFFNSSYSYFYLSTGAQLPPGTAVVFSGTTPPAGLVFGTTYYIAVNSPGNPDYLSATPGGPRLHFNTNGTAVSIATLANFAPFLVKAGTPAGEYWAFANSSDWGNLNNGYWQIPDAQAGLANSALVPWINFDFGVAVQPMLWRIQGLNGGVNSNREDLPRLIEFFSSTDNFATNSNFEAYFSCPPLPGAIFDVLIPNAGNRRYWRICLRSRWSDTLRYAVFSLVSAYAGSRHFWKNAQITFTGNITAALAGLTRSVTASYSGKLTCAPLPIAPANGDTFTIQRGCGRTFNDCAARLNTENFGGFDTLPYQTIIR